MGTKFRSKIINFEKNVSQSILNDIVKGKQIDYKKYHLDKFEKKINDIKICYQEVKKDLNKSFPRYWLFWKIISQKYENFQIKKKIKNDSNISELSNSKHNVLTTMYTKYLGFNPSILTLLVFNQEINEMLYSKKNLIMKNFLESNCFWPPNPIEKNMIHKCLMKENFQIISTLCPDYDYKRIGKNFFEYTFSKLNSGLGLGGLRLNKSSKKIHNTLKSFNKNFTHDLFYGDFESFSKENLKRLKINQKQFLICLNKSVENFKKINVGFNKIGLFVKALSSKNEWIERKKSNEKKIVYKYNNDNKFMHEINSIARSRKKLYKTWYTDLSESEHFKLVMDQGAEYTTMGDILSENYPNPLIIGADHPRMKIFYYFNTTIPILYLTKSY